MNVGIIGLGEVAQLMHLPILHDMRDAFTITAVSDVSPSLTDFIAKKYCINESFSDPEELIEKTDAELIFILSPDQYHCRYTELALKAGKHVFVEKPAALFSGELKKLAEIRKDDILKRV